MNFFPFQIQALDTTQDQNRVAYYMDMGLGKTYVGTEKNEAPWGAGQSGDLSEI